ncbi:hypothetical protein MXB_2069 [Myxobolus squamalis]|nr:hypothetical protein MXB_2069 [Myxobolus squamalis]
MKFFYSPYVLSKIFGFSKLYGPKFFISSYNINDIAKHQKKPLSSIPSKFVPGTCLIKYTCNICKNESINTFSKNSYLNGVVIVKCRKCNNHHLIADNLKWFGDSKTNIEDIMKQNGVKITTNDLKDGSSSFDYPLSFYPNEKKKNLLKL